MQRRLARSVLFATLSPRAADERHPIDISLLFHSLFNNLGIRISRVVLFEVMARIDHEVAVLCDEIHEEWIRIWKSILEGQFVDLLDF